MIVPTNPSALSAPVVFMADIHMDDRVPKRISRFEKFLLEDLPAMGVHHLFLLGDIFNIWYRDKELEESYGQRILEMLNQFVIQGGSLDYVVGNRDFALCFDESLTVRFNLHKNRIIRTIGDLTFCLCHGDDLCRGDFGYRLLHGAIRQQIPMNSFHALSSERKRKFVNMMINLTYEVKKNKSYWKVLPHWPYVHEQVDQGIDVFIQGHRHYRTYRILEGKKRMGRFFVLPRWIRYASGLYYDPAEDRFQFFDR
jgi:UDP-2,3-diacylglucosamine hydrolase